MSYSFKFGGEVLMNKK